MEAAILLAQEAEVRKREIEQLRDIPEDLIQVVKELGLSRQWVAKVYDGPQRRISDVMKLWQKMAYYNGSLTWVASVTNSSSLISGFLPPEMARSIFQSPDAMVGGFAGPAGKAILESDSIRINGNWSWGSGIKHCSHIVAGIQIFEDDQFKGAGVLFAKPDEVQFVDNWNVVGMRGTHSIDYSIENLMLNGNRWINFPPKESNIDAPLYRFSFLGALSLSVASVGLGLAERACSEILDLLKLKRPLGQRKMLSQQAVVQDKAGQIIAEYETAQSVFYNIINDAESEVEVGACSKIMKAKIRLASCKTTEMCLNVVRNAYELAGGHAIWDKNKFEELHRDMHVVSQHAMVSKANYRTVGAVYLENDVPEFLL